MKTFIRGQSIWTSSLSGRVIRGIVDKGNGDGECGLVQCHLVQISYSIDGSIYQGWFTADRVFVSEPPVPAASYANS